MRSQEELRDSETDESAHVTSQNLQKTTSRVSLSRRDSGRGSLGWLTSSVHEDPPVTRRAEGGEGCRPETKATSVIQELSFSPSRPRRVW